MYSGSFDACIVKWGLTNFDAMETYRGHTEGEFVQVGLDLDCALCIVQSPSPKDLMPIKVCKAFVFAAVYGIVGVDGFLISASRDSTVRVWNESSSSESDRQILRGHSSAVLCLCLVGQYLYTGSDDCLIKK